jgi:hypothetical protein
VLTLALYGLLAIGLMGGLFLLAVRFLPAGEQIAPALRDEPVWALAPDRSLKAADVAELRLPVALRGYRFAETDELLDRVVEELRKRDERIDQLYRVLITLPPELLVEIPSLTAGDPLAEAEAAQDSAADPPAPESATGDELVAVDEPVADEPVGEPPTDPAPDSSSGPAAHGG